MKTPILYLIYNRPDLIRESIISIKTYKPLELYVAADGPKNAKDKKLTDECRSIIHENIDWECQIHQLYRNENLGCGKGVSDAISWFFKHVDSGIILEDDLIPSLSFFNFCEEMLRKYREEKSIFSVTGVNWQNGRKRGNASYYFSSYPGIWGWATWKDRWEKYDYDMSELDEFITNSRIDNISIDKYESEYHISSFRNSRTVDTWDYQWKFTVFNKNGFCIIPNKNLISNVGFGEDATHTITKNWRHGRKSENLTFPLIHPTKIRRHKKADKYFATHVFPIKRVNILKQTARRLKNLIYTSFGN